MPIFHYAVFSSCNIDNGQPLDGIFLDCCNSGGSTKSPKKKPADAPSVAPPVGSCSKFSAFANLGLTGDSCPTTDGVYLDCCNVGSPTNRRLLQSQFRLNNRNLKEESSAHNIVSAF